MTDNAIRQVARLLYRARSVLFVTGAGISADSGLPTYRGVGGLYDGAHTEDGVSIEEALSGPMFARRPALTWKYMWQIGAACSGAAPNAAHKVIADIEAEKEDVWVITQNVDGLHRAAGTQNLVEVHGDMFDLYCVRCGCEYTAGKLLESFQGQPTLPPICRQCGGVIRPRVVLFEETLPVGVLQSLTELSARDFDVVFAIGTTAVFPYIRWPIERAQENRRATVEINPTRTMLSSSFQHRVPLGAAEALQAIRSCTI